MKILILSIFSFIIFASPAWAEYCDSACEEAQFDEDYPRVPANQVARIQQALKTNLAGNELRAKCRREGGKAAYAINAVYSLITRANLQEYKYEVRRSKVGGNILKVKHRRGVEDFDLATIYTDGQNITAVSIIEARRKATAPPTLLDPEPNSAIFHDYFACD